MAKKWWLFSEWKFIFKRNLFITRSRVDGSCFLHYEISFYVNKYFFNEDRRFLDISLVDTDAQKKSTSSIGMEIFVKELIIWSHVNGSFLDYKNKFL